MCVHGTVTGVKWILWQTILIIPLSSQGNIEVKINGEPSQILTQSYEFYFKSLIGQQIPWSEKVSIMGVSNKVQRGFLSQ